MKMGKAKSSSIGDLQKKAGVKRKCHHLTSLPCLLKDIPNPHSPCNRCVNANKENRLCLDCKVVLCGSFVSNHALKHYQHTNHSLFLSYRDLSVFCYRCCLEAQVDGIRWILVQEGCNFSLKQQPRADNDDVALTKKPPTKIPAEVQWEGHLVNKSYVELLSEIKKVHPKTFEHLSFNIPALYTSALNALGDFYTLFASKRVADMTIDEITHFGDMLRDLELLKFNVGWLLERLDLIKEMRFNSPLVDAYEDTLRSIKTKQKELEELKLLCSSKAVLVKEKFGFLAENVSTRSAADGLLAESTNTSFKSE